MRSAFSVCFAPIVAVAFTAPIVGVRPVQAKSAPPAINLTAADVTQPEGFPFFDSFVGIAAAIFEYGRCSAPGLSGVIGGPPLASFTTTPGGAHATDFTATIDWGDGTATAGNIVEQFAHPGTFDVRGNHDPFPDPRALRTTIVVRSQSGASATAEGGILVTEVRTDALACPPATAEVSVPLRAQIVGFIRDIGSADPSEYYASVDWGDGATSEATISRMALLFYSVSGTHTYLRAGVRTITIRVGEVGATVATMAAASARIIVGQGRISPVTSGSDGLSSATASGVIATALVATVTIVVRRRRRRREPRHRWVLGARDDR